MCDSCDENDTAFEQGIVCSDSLLRYGTHIPFQGTVCSTILLAINTNQSAFQFFLGNPQSFKRTSLLPSDYKKCSELLQRNPLDVFSHFPYVANLAGSVKSLAWNGDEEQDRKTIACLQGLQTELDTIASFRCKERNGGVVIHPGSFPDKQKGIRAISKSINRLNFVSGSCLLLENSAGGGTTIATTLEEIRQIIDGVEEAKRENIGVCIDTAHIWGANKKYHLSKPESVERLFDDFDRIVGSKYLRLIHLNDSKAGHGSGRDLHERLGYGNIWSKDMSGLLKLLSICKRRGIPVVLETHFTDLQTLSELSQVIDENDK